MPSAKKPRLTPAQAQKELDRRIDAAVASLTAEAIADGHGYQLELLTCEDQSVCLMCSRRAGKSIGCVGLCCLTGLKTPNVYCLYLSLTADQSAPRYSECKALLDKFGIPYTPSEVDQTVTLPNKSQIRFTGTDDRRRIQALLGGQFASGVVVIDEAQSDPGLLEWLLKDVLEPAVSETTADKPTPGRIVVAGVVPESAAGYFNKLWEENNEVPGAAWKCMGWGRSDNPHERDFRKHLDAYLKKYKLEESDPLVQRNWWGRRVFDKNATAYRYSDAKNAYRGTPAPWLDKFPIPTNDQGVPLGTLLAVTPPPNVSVFATGTDPASKRDCCAIVLWGWGSGSSDVYQLAEFVTEPGSGIRQDQWIEVLNNLHIYYPNIVRNLRDAGSAAEDILLSDYNLLIEAVTKGPGSVKERVERTAALLGQGRCHVLAGSQLEQQYKTCRWDQAARERGKWVLLPSIPNDVSDAGDYGLTPFCDISQPKKVPETMEQMHERLFRQSFNPPAQYGYQEDDGLTQLLGEPGAVND